MARPIRVFWFVDEQRRTLSRLVAGAAVVTSVAAIAWAATDVSAEEARHVDTKIAGGQLAEDGRFPWMAAITTAEEPDVGYCGGTLIADDVVLTAGHCFDDLSPAELVVRHGDVTLANADSYEIADVVVAEGYDHDLQYDWAVVKLAEPVPGAEPLPLAATDDGDWSTFEVAGWGVTGHTAPSPDLRWAEVPYIDDTECAELNEDGGFFPKTQLCAGELDGEEVNACPVDSGGPLMAKVDGRTVLAGIVSWGSDCHGTPEPGVYASVGAQIDDIEAAVDEVDGGRR